MLPLQREISLGAELPQSKLANKKTGNVNEDIFDIRVIDVYLTSTRRSIRVF